MNQNLESNSLEGREADPAAAPARRPTVEKEDLGLVKVHHYKYKYKYLEKEDLGLVDVPRPVEFRPHDP